MRFIKTGEVRCPKKGEYFINSWGVEEQARLDFEANELEITQLADCPLCGSILKYTDGIGHCMGSQMNDGCNFTSNQLS